MIHSNETSLLKDMIEALGLEQHVNEYTHNANHIIDLLMTQSIGLIKVKKCKTAEFISDHQLVYMDVNISKPENKTKIIEIRPTTSITVDRFSKLFDPNKILEAQSLSSAIDLFNNMVEHALNQIAPVKKVTSTRNVTQP